MVAVREHSRSSYFTSIVPETGGGAWFWRALQGMKNGYLNSTEDCAEGKFVTLALGGASTSNKQRKRKRAGVVNGITRLCVDNKAESRESGLAGVNRTKRRSRAAKPG